MDEVRTFGTMMRNLLDFSEWLAGNTVGQREAHQERAGAQDGCTGLQVDRAVVAARTVERQFYSTGTDSGVEGSYPTAETETVFPGVRDIEPAVWQG